MNGGTPPGIAATAPSGSGSRKPGGAHGTRPSAVRHSPLKNAERSSDVAPSSRTGRPGDRRGERPQEAVALADADEPRLGEDELDRGADELAVRLAGADCRRHRRAGVRHREAGIEQVDVGAVREHRDVRLELGQRRRQAGARDEEVVDRPAALAAEHLEAEHVDAVLGEVPRDRGEAPRPVAKAEAARAGRREAPGSGAG